MKFSCDECSLLTSPTFLDIDVESVLQAFAESYRGPWDIYAGENDYEPEPPLHECMGFDASGLRRTSTSGHERLQLLGASARSEDEVKPELEAWPAF